MARSIAVFTPLGWAPSKVAPVPVYEEALRIYDQSNSTDMAEEILVDGWNVDGGLALRLRRMLNFGGDADELTRIFRARYDLVQKAFMHHSNGAYEASVPIILAQADGMVLDLTGKRLFVAGKPKHLVDSETLAGLPEGLRLLAPLPAENQDQATTSGALRRHGILHGRELGYATRISRDTRSRAVNEDQGKGNSTGCPIGVKLSRGQAAPEGDGRYSSVSGAWEWSTLP